MNGFTRIAVATLASFAVAVPALAERPSHAGPPPDAGSSQKSQQASRGSAPTDPGSKGKANKPEKTADHGRPQTTTGASGKEKGEAARAAAKERRDAIKAKIAERRAAIKQSVCEKHEATIARVMPHLSQGALSVKRSIDTMYERVAGFYESGQLTVHNYDELAAAVEAAKADAEASLATVKEFEFEIDCDTPGVGRQLDGFRTAVAETRDELHAYRKALVALISALRSEEADSNAESSEQGDESNTTTTTTTTSDSDDPEDNECDDEDDEDDVTTTTTTTSEVCDDE